MGCQVHLHILQVHLKDVPQVCEIVIIHQDVAPLYAALDRLWSTLLGVLHLQVKIKRHLTIDIIVTSLHLHMHVKVFDMLPTVRTRYFRNSRAMLCIHVLLQIQC